MTQLGIPPQAILPTSVRRLGVVSFLNALPLRAYLPDRAGIRIIPRVPSGLVDGLLCGEYEAALLPIIDFWRHRERLQLMGDACIASEGETLTVRVFSRVPPDQITRLHADGDSHTSVVLARLIWRQLYSKRIELERWSDGDGRGLPAEADAVLVIGDKVIRSAPRGYGFEVDLGAAWKHLTGLPFVFAAWYGVRPVDPALAVELEAARDAGVADAERLAREAAAVHGWPEAIAVEYLTRIMRYTLTPPMRSAMQRFFELVDQHRLLT